MKWEFCSHEKKTINYQGGTIENKIEPSFYLIGRPQFLKKIWKRIRPGMISVKGPRENERNKFGKTTLLWSAMQTASTLNKRLVYNSLL